ncbi:MAG TPA: oligoendopeptidase F [Eubacteriales bacterium]|nr:oligoendopeptidase F [Eubacteriales bacterium]
MSYTNRTEIPENYKWNLGNIFKTVKDWETSFEAASNRIGDFDCYKGKLNEPKVILEMMRKLDSLLLSFDRLESYAFMNYCEDSKDSDAQTRYGKVSSMFSKFAEKIAFIDPEMSKLSEDEFNKMIADPAFSDYTERLKDMRDGKAHILSENEEKLMAMCGDFERFFQEIFNRLDSGDIDFGSITVDGKEVKLTHGSYATCLQNRDQSVRKAAFERYYKGFIDLINTISAVYEGSVKKDIFNAKARNFGSAMEAALFNEKVDKVVYDNLIKSVNGTLEPLHEYIGLRKKVLKVKELNMYDLSVPMIENADLSCDFEEAFQYVLKGLKPLGEDYQALLKKAKDERWMDVHETPTKRSGAYSLGVFGVHPYVMLNYQKTTHDIFTIAHELGHSMHSYYSSNTQPYAKAGYKIFVAEVASTCNEVLLLNYLLNTVTDVNVKKYLLSYYLDMIRTTMYRQTMFAEFEAIAHDYAEKGQPLAADLLNEKYYELNKKYYGDEVVHNEQIKYEWSRIPHFYRAFYVYKYATGITSAITLAQKILKEGEPAVTRYKKFLTMGCSMDPVSELKAAGVDLTTAEPFETVAKSFMDTLDQLKKLCE